MSLYAQKSVWVLEHSNTNVLKDLRCSVGPEVFVAMKNYAKLKHQEDPVGEAKCPSNHSGA